VAGSGVVDQNVKITSFSQREIECLFHGMPISQVETNGVPSRQFWDAFQIARRAPDLVTFSDE
jgi:hypothetical protein